MQCEQSGCSGSIQDGYCDVCGAPSMAQSASRQSASAANALANAPSSRSGRTGGTVATAASYRLASAPIGSARSGRSTSTRRLAGASRTRAPRLGAGLTTVPSTPITDPRSAVMAVAEVEESKRDCPSCGAEVGRSRGDKPGRTEGFCARCGNQFSFTPKLKAGDVLGGQYEVVGCLAHGGLGWIYLARDKNVSDRFVVLKGLLNSGDADAFQAAIAERQFLAEVEQPLIVEIYNFVSHNGAGYTVMEYVGGKSLKSILKDRMKANAGTYDPVPVDQAIAYIIEILPAFSYLHANGLLYCDFKPDNVIQQGDGLKLIDLGGVRRIDDTTSAIYGTVGFQAPEIAELGPSIASEIFTIGRTLCVLAMEFRGYQTTYVSTLPPPEATPLFQQYDSLYRVLLKATAAAPDDRFQSTDELREQLFGVLREIVAMNGSGVVAHSSASQLFDVPAVSGSTLAWDQLPSLRIDPNDEMAGWLSGVSVADARERLASLENAPQRTVEVQLASIRAAIDAGDVARANDGISEVLAVDPWEWRAVWLSGLSALSQGDADAAIASFNAVYGQVAGELAPKLALGHSCELAGQRDAAIGFYSVCVRCDANYSAPAAFGLARVQGQLERGVEALAALDLVSSVNRAYVEARKLRASLLLESNSLDGCAQAMSTIAAVSMSAQDRHGAEVKIYERALRCVLGGAPRPDLMIGGIVAEEMPLRAGLEGAYRELAAITEDRSARVVLVDAANRVRPRTLV